MQYCKFCMHKMDEGDAFCEKCGRSSDYACPPHHLMPGTMLNNKYLVGAAIGEGGFGITYIGREVNLDIKVAIKEYYPNGYASRNNTISMGVFEPQTEDRKVFFEKGKGSFLNEARALARFPDEPGIVSVRDFFEENNTAYIVMEYLDGKTLKTLLRENGTMTDEQVVMMLMPMMHSLQNVHKEGIIHRDISPDNIMVTGSRVKLLDFGAARTVSAEANQSLSVVLKPGYAPEEQYRSRGNQGPWTDIYALCATMYKCITGITPEESNDRMIKDELQKPSDLQVPIDPGLEAVIMKGLSVRAEDRYQNMEALLADLTGARTGATQSGGAEDGSQTIYAGQKGNRRLPQTPVVPPDVPQKPKPQPPAPADKSGKNKNLVIGIVAGVVALAAIAAIVFFVLKGKEQEPGDEDPGDVSVSEQAPEATGGDADASEQETGTTVAESTAPAAPTTTAPVETTVNSSTLFRPGRSYYTNVRIAYCYCTEPVQDYVKMRYGPDKYSYDVITTLPNNTKVTAETSSYNGWTLCVADGVEGWIRSDFLFDSPVREEEDETEPNVIIIKSAVTLVGTELEASNVSSDRSFEAARVIDGRGETCWCVNTNEDGAVGASLKLTFEKAATVTGIRLLNGNMFQMEENLYESNGQVHKFRLDFSDGSSKTFTASYNDESDDAYETFYFNDTVKTDSIVLTVLSSYVGKKFDSNVCIGEIVVF